MIDNKESLFGKPWLIRRRCKSFSEAYNLRIKILKNKSEEIKKNFSESYDLSEDVFKFLASEITSSVREMVGAFNRILAFSKINTKSPTI